MRALTPPPWKWVRDVNVYQENCFYPEGVQSTLYSAFIRHHHCCLISNGEGVFMNVHKHIPCQVSVLCMLSKHPGVLIIFPSTGFIRCVSSKDKISFSALTKWERWLLTCSCGFVLVCVKGTWEVVGGGLASPILTVLPTSGHGSILALFCVFCFILFYD